MVKTRNHTKQSSKNNHTGVQTRQQVRKSNSNSTVECIQLPSIVPSKEMSKRFKIKKEIAKKSKESQIERKFKKQEKHYKEFKEHKKQSAEEMTSVWKNFDSAFDLIDGLCNFRECLESWMLKYL